VFAGQRDSPVSLLSAASAATTAARRAAAINS
jgi:hypothetical protein